MSVSVSRQAGSFESVNGRQRCGIRPCACQTAQTLEAATPTAFAIARSVQWVAGQGDAGRPK